MLKEDKSITKAAEPNALQLKPLEWVTKAEELYAQTMAAVGAALINKCEADELTAIHDFVMTIEKSAKGYIKASKKQLYEQIKAHGKKITKKGTIGLDLGNGRAVYARPRSTKYEDAKVEALCRAKALDLATYMDQEISYTTNEFKLANAIARELITQNELNACLPDPIVYNVGHSKPLGEEGLKEPEDE